MHCGSKGLCEVKARVLRVSLGYKPYLEALYRPICVPFYFEVPPRANDLPARGELDNLPSAIVVVSFKFFKTSFPPLTGFSLFLRFFEGPWFSGGGKVGIGSRVEGIVIGFKGVFLLLFLALVIL